MIVNSYSFTGIFAFGDNADQLRQQIWGVGLMLTRAHDYGDRGIRANAVCLGRTRKPALEAAGQRERMTHRIRAIPLGRAETPREIGQGPASLLSDGAVLPNRRNPAGGRRLDDRALIPAMTGDLRRRSGFGRS